MYECDTCVKGDWYCKNKCDLRPPKYSPIKQQEILSKVLNETE